MMMFVATYGAAPLSPDRPPTPLRIWRVAPTGSVVGTQASGVNKEVSDCVGDVISQIVFPKPKGGGLVQVRYPFNFRPTGG